MTYADMITLMFAFFVILFALSEPKTEKLTFMQEALEAGGFAGKEKEEKEDPYDQLKEQMQMVLEDMGMDSAVGVTRTPKGLELELSSSSFYQAGSAKFKKEAIPVLEQIANTIKDFDVEGYQIEINGHTDDVPIKSPLFPSNWELSAMRSAIVARFFIAMGLTKERMKVAGFADTQPKVPNIDQDGNPIPANREINRRVVIKIEQKE